MKSNFVMFGAIEIGSYEVRMKIFEISKKHGIREIDHICKTLVLGNEIYEGGKIGIEPIKKLCGILLEFRRIMKSYHVEKRYVYATSAIREAKNRGIILYQIRQKTGFEVEVLENAMQRFLHYKSIASKEKAFQSMILNPTAIVDLDGGSLQISLFDKENLVATQNLKLGILRLKEEIAYFRNVPVINYEKRIEELIGNEIIKFKKIYLEDRNISNIVIASDFMTQALRTLDKSVEGYAITTGEFENLYEKLKNTQPEDIVSQMQIPYDYEWLLKPAMMIYKRVMEELNADFFWITGAYLNDGVACDYAQKLGMIRMEHDFENDIIESAKNISERYAGDREHGNYLDRIATTIFDSIKKISGLSEREQLLLRIAVILKNCGDYICIGNPTESTCHIIRETEIIGLTLREREIIASAIRQSHSLYEPGEEDFNLPDMQDCILVMKLAAILSLTGAVDKSGRNKFQMIKAVIKEKNLVVTVDTREDITLEKELFRMKADEFEEVYHVRPFLRQKRKW